MIKARIFQTKGIAHAQKPWAGEIGRQSREVDLLQIIQNIGS